MDEINYKEGDEIEKFDIVKIELPEGSIIKIIKHPNTSTIGALYLIIRYNHLLNIKKNKPVYAIRLNHFHRESIGWINEKFRPTIKIIRYGG